MLAEGVHTLVTVNDGLTSLQQDKGRQASYPSHVSDARL
jgi:hypothetical protein